MRTTIKFEGPLFNNDNNFKKGLKEALEETGEWAQNRIERLTPVRTGRLKSGWKVSSRTVGYRASLIVDNDVPYSPFVEKKVGMVRQNIPAINKKLKETVENKIKDII